MGRPGASRSSESLETAECPEPAPLGDVTAVQALAADDRALRAGRGRVVELVRIATLYAAGKRRRVGRSGTSGSGVVSIGQGCTPGLGGAGEIAIAGNLRPRPRSVIRGGGASHRILAERAVLHSIHSSLPRFLALPCLVRGCHPNLNRWPRVFRFRPARSVQFSAGVDRLGYKPSATKICRSRGAMGMSDTTR